MKTTSIKDILLLGFIVLSFSYCSDPINQKVVYSENENPETLELKQDSTMVKIADVPIYIDSTQYLIHPIGEYKIYRGRGSSFYGYSKYGTGSFSSSSFNDNDEIDGTLNNLKFQHINSEKLVPLTSKNIRIKHISFLRTIFNNTKKKVLVYRVLDQDTNQDGMLNYFDVESLYMSNVDGSEFKKITPNLQELIDWKILKVNNKMYLRSIEDTNKNGEFDKDDKMHYWYIDFNLTDPQVIEYNPV